MMKTFVSRQLVARMEARSAEIRERQSRISLRSIRATLFGAERAASAS